MGQPGLYVGRTVRIDGPIDPQFLLTDPAFKGLVPVSDRSDLGTVGVRPGQDQSDLVQAPALLCRNMTDFPSFRYNFKNVGQMLSRTGGCALSSLEIGPILERAGEDVCILATQTEAKGPVFGSMEERLDLFRYEMEWTPTSLYGKMVGFKNPSRGPRIAVLDLGIRSGLLRFLREHGSVTLYPHDHPFGEIGGEADLLMISNGPGSVPGPGLVRTVRRFVDTMDQAPVFAMGIGALALAEAMGAPSLPMSIPHRSVSFGVSIGGTVMPSYQNHDHGPGAIDRAAMITRAHDDTIEMMRVDLDGRDRWLSMFDTLPEFGTLPEDPLMEFLGGVR